MLLNEDRDALIQQSDTQYVSRLQYVSRARRRQPMNDAVTVIGDGTGTHEVVKGDKLKNLEKLKQIGTTCAVGRRLADCHEKLSEALKETGYAALARALGNNVVAGSYYIDPTVGSSYDFHLLFVTGSYYPASGQTRPVKLDSLSQHIAKPSSNNANANQVRNDITAR